jgi:magnesium chelatase accessory protein
MSGEAPTRVPGDWPHREFSRSVRSSRLDWHVQVLGKGPTVVLLHGTGSSAHSWADVLPDLVPFATLVVPDLPGHGYTTGATLASLSLPEVAADLDRLLVALAVDAPTLVVGHSAGAALALRWAMGTAQRPRAIVGFNPSLIAPPATYTRLLAPLITPVATSAPMTALLASIAGHTRLVDSLLTSTRSRIPDAQRTRYATLFRKPAHVRGAMGLMAAADLPAIQRDARDFAVAMTFVVGARDAWVPEAPLRRVIASAFPSANVVRWDGGHVLHEEEPARAAALIRSVLDPS